MIGFFLIEKYDSLLMDIATKKKKINKKRKDPNFLNIFGYQDSQWPRRLLLVKEKEIFIKKIDDNNHDDDPKNDDGQDD